MSEVVTVESSEWQNLTPKVQATSSTSTVRSNYLFEMVEIRDGLLSTPDKALMKARNVRLLPESIQAFYNDKEQVYLNNIYTGARKVSVKSETKLVEFDREFFEYLKDLGWVRYYLSNVPLPGEGAPLYPLVVTYKYGICVLAPLED